MQHPRTSHLDVVFRILRYLHGIFLSSSSNLKLQGYTDSDRLDVPQLSLLLQDISTMLGASPISWKFTKPLGADQFRRLASNLGVCPSSPPSPT